MGINPLMLLNSPAVNDSLAKSQKADATGGSAIGGTATSGTFNFGGSSLTTPLLIVAGVVAVIFILRR